MQFFQPTLYPPAEKVTLEGRTAVVTGATSGIGLETARQLLQRRASTVILAVRNVQKGEEARSTLLADPVVRALDTAPTVTVMKLDMADYASVQAFCTAFTAAEAAAASHPRLDILILNAGIGPITFERSATTGHEQTIQVNYLSNVVLLFALLPLLRATAERTGAPSRVAWVGSRAHRSSLPSLIARAPSFLQPQPQPAAAVPAGESVFRYFDAEDQYSGFSRYPDSKLVSAMFMYELAGRMGAGDGNVIVNMCCPGMVDTGITDPLPWYLRMVLRAVKTVRARTAEQGAWVTVNAAVVAGAESHGRFLLDMDCVEECDFLKTENGKKMQKTVWEETVAEVSKYVDIP